MTILSQLSSQVRDRSEYANRKAAVAVLEDPDLLAEIAAGLASPNPSLLGDCCEVMTMVAADRPDWVAPHAPELARLLRHMKTRVRWEAMHALALVSRVEPGVIEPLLPLLGEMIRGDASVIVRDYAVEALGNYAGSSRDAALKAYPLLREALTAWGGKQSARALRGLAQAAGRAAELKEELLAVAYAYRQKERGTVRKAAKELERTLERPKRA